MTTTSATSSSTASTASTATTSTTSTSSSSSTSTIGQQILSSLGVNTGASLTGLAANIAKAQYASQNDALNTQLTQVQLQISEATQLKSDLLSFQSSLSSLIDGGNLLPSPTVANSSVASATLPIGSSGASSSYSLEVTQLAAPQTMAAASMASGTTVQGGTLTFNFGTVTNGTFSADTTHAAATVTIPDGSSLTATASIINSAGIGVTAYVSTNTDGSQQLVMKGTQGAANAFTISASGNGTTGTTSLSSFAYDPSATGGYSVTTQAANAAYKLDGIARTSTSNTITNAAPGLSLKLTGTNVGNPTTVSFGDPSSGITTAMQNLTTVLNQLVGEMNTDMSNNGGGLANDSGAKQMARQFSALAGTVLMPNAAAGAPRTLADLGLSTQKDGTYTLDTSKLATALANYPDAVSGMFTKGVNGVYATVNKMVSSLTTSTDPGSLAGSVTRYTTLQKSITDQQANLATLQSQLQDRLTTQYAATDAAVAGYNSTLSYLKQQIAVWTNSNNSNN
ncbi:flagellar filament capping protein FliD [Novosphingobium sp.]|uniref:flagellar filament capping protein FliD n=1 Tax=Novosphingobium sp. TaxID=1874826 RepID=UPI0031CFBA3E